MRPIIRCGVCLTCLTVLVSPDSAAKGLGRARVVSPRRVLVSCFSQNYFSDPSYLFIRIDTYQSDVYHVRNGVVEQVAFTP